MYRADSLYVIEELEYTEATQASVYVYLTATTGARNVAFFVAYDELRYSFIVSY